MKKNIKLENLKIESFVTDLGDKASKVKGKGYLTQQIITCVVPCEPDVSETCPPTDPETVYTDCATCVTCNYTCNENVCNVISSEPQQFFCER